MVNPFEYILGGLLSVFSLWIWYHVVRTLLYYRSLADVEPEVIDVANADGDRVALEGAASIEETAPAGELAAPESDRRVGMYVWRVAKADVGSNNIDFRNLRVEKDKDTVGAGIEAGTVTLAEGGTTVRVDPTWIREAHDAPAITDFTVVPGMGHKNFEHYLWESRFVHFAGDESEVPLDRLEGVVQKHDAETSLDGMWLQSRTLEEGDMLSVYGELDVSDGTPVIRGTEQTPLFVTNEGFDGLRGKLLKQARNSAVGASFWLTLAVVVLFFLDWSV